MVLKKLLRAFLWFGVWARVTQKAYMQSLGDKSPAVTWLPLTAGRRRASNATTKWFPGTELSQPLERDPRGCCLVSILEVFLLARGKFWYPSAWKQLDRTCGGGRDKKYCLWGSHNPKSRNWKEMLTQLVLKQAGTQILVGLTNRISEFFAIGQTGFSKNVKKN